MYKVVPALIVAFDEKLLLRNGSKELRLKEVLAGCLLGLISIELNYGGAMGHSRCMAGMVA